MAAFAFINTEYPTNPGCYLMKDKRGRVIYVGKAKNLRNRLSSYFQPSNKDRKAKRMIAYVHDIEVVLLNNEYEALVLENNLIKQYKPRFNRVLMADTSGYYYIQMTGEKYPRFLRFRKNRYVKAVQGLREVTDGKLFGPFIRAVHRETILEFLNDTFQIRTCKPLGNRVCLRYHLGRCSGVCEHRVSDAEYAEQVGRAGAFLGEPQNQMLALMHDVMQKHAEVQEYEKAQKVKSQLEAFTTGLQRQIVETEIHHDQDVVYFGELRVLVANIKQGVLQRLSLYDLPRAENANEAQREFINATYATVCPPELITNKPTSARQLLKLHRAGGTPTVTVTCPKNGVQADLLHLCADNYTYRVKKLQNKPTKKPKAQAKQPDVSAL